MKKLVTASALVAALCLPALADSDNGNGNKIGWSNPNNPAAVRLASPAVRLATTAVRLAR
jgi:hypothetical protein